MQKKHVGFAQIAVLLRRGIHELKPSPEAFRKVAEMAGIKPEETLFIDDLETSCKSAEALGFQTFCPPANTDWCSNYEF